MDEAFLDPDPMTQLSRWLAVARDTIGSVANTSLTRYTDAQGENRRFESRLPLQLQVGVGFYFLASHFANVFEESN